MNTNPQSSKVRRFPNRTAEVTPPHSIEAEQSTLGGLMLDNAAWDKVAGILTEADFYRADHRLIFRAMQDLASKGSSFDLVTLSEALKELGQLDNASGETYLAVLARDTPSAANVDTYAEIVRRRSINRQRIEAFKNQDWQRIEELNRQTNAEKRRFNIISAAELWDKEFAPVKWAVPGILPEGVTICAGSPKIGKSWPALGLGVSVALGNIKVDQGDVLYLALEDTDRRLKQRLINIIPTGRPPERLRFP